MITGDAFGISIAGLFAPQLGQRHCKCGEHRVDASDIAAKVGGLLIAHGLFHCFQIAGRA